jgi:hypothetical protein
MTKRLDHNLAAVQDDFSGCREFILGMSSLKIHYKGVRALKERAICDPHLIVGILGDSAGTTPEVFETIGKARPLDARRNRRAQEQQRGDQPNDVDMRRAVFDGQISPRKAVHTHRGRPPCARHRPLPLR